MLNLYALYFFVLFLQELLITLFLNRFFIFHFLFYFF